jgi:uncharacterized protein YxjI
MSDQPTTPDPQVPLPPAPASEQGTFAKPKGATDAERVLDQVTRQAPIAPDLQPASTGNLLSEPVLVVNQKAKLIELTAEFKVFNSSGAQVGSVAQVGQSALKKAARLVTSLDQFMTHTYEIRGADGAPIMSLTRPRKFMKSRFTIAAADGSPIGEVVQKNVFGKIRFNLSAGGQEIGTMNAENWRAWNFNILDTQGQEVGRITKTFEGLLKTAFTTADNYVVQLSPALQGTARQLVVACALCVDTALKQDGRGLNNLIG